MYKITQHTRSAAKRIGVEVRPSKLKGKKIDVIKDGKKVASVGAIGYGDYGTFLKTLGPTEAAKHRRAYLLRHAKEPKTKYVDGRRVRTPSYYADELLW